MIGLLCHLAFATPVQVQVSGLLQDPSLSGASVSVSVQKIGGASVFSHNANLPLIPASTMKLIPSSLAFRRLGPNFTPLTIVWKTGNVVRIRGGGDPTLSSAHLVKMANEVGAKPTDKVEFDDGLFGVEWRCPAWGAKEPQYCPPVGALVADRGQVQVWAEPGKAYLRPHSFGIRLLGAPGTGTGSASVSWEKYGVALRVSGKLPKGTKAKRIATVTLPDPGLAAAAVFGSSPRRVANLRPGAAVLLPDGNDTFTSYEHGDSTIAVLRAPPVWRLSALSLTESDNYIAETVLRLCGGETGASGKWVDSISLAAHQLTQMGISQESFSLFDGSGLSRLNRLSAKSLSDLLERMSTGPSGDLFVSGMATPGKGTLKSRLSSISVWAKTGSLNGVVTLAGIVKAVNGNAYSFAILINGGSGPAYKQREIQDAIVSRIARIDTE